MIEYDWESEWHKFKFTPKNWSVWDLVDSPEDPTIELTISFMTAENCFPDAEQVISRIRKAP